MSDTEQKIKIKGREFIYNPQKLDCDSVNKLDIEIAKSNLLLFNKIAKSHDFNFILFYGTLLGAIREQNFIANDTDIDVVTTNEEGMLNIIPDLQQEGFLFIRYYSSKTRTIYSFLKNDVYIDVYIAKKAGEHSCYLSGAKIKSSFIDKWKTINFIGDSFFIPSEYEKLLILLYGKDWRIPQNKPATFPITSRRDYTQLMIQFFPKSFRNWVKKIIGMK